MSNVAPLGWRIKDWCKRIGICPATFYLLEREAQPQSIRIRSRRLIIEHPEEYLKRVADSQGQRAA